VVKRLPHGHAPAKKVGGKLVPRARKVKEGNKRIWRGAKGCKEDFYRVPMLLFTNQQMGYKHVFEGLQKHFFSNTGLLWVGQTPVAKPAFATRWTWPQVSGRVFFWWMRGEWGKPQLVSETVFVDDADHLLCAFCDYEAFGIFDPACGPMILQS